MFGILTIIFNNYRAFIKTLEAESHLPVITKIVKWKHKVQLYVQTCRVVHVCWLRLRDSIHVVASPETSCNHNISSTLYY